MQVAVETLQGLERRLKVVIPAEKVDEMVETRLKKEAGKVKLKGFRPGKVPLNVVRTQFGGAIRQEVVEELIRSSFFEAVEQEHLHLAGRPHIEPKSMDPHQPLEYEATFEVYPEVEIKELSSVKIEKFKAEITDQDIEKVIEKLQKQHVTWEEISRPAEKGDRLMIDFEGTVEGEKFQGGSAKNMAIILGSGNMIPGFEEGLLGIKPQETRQVSITFPKDYPHQLLAGKPAVFTVTVHQLFKPLLPNVDDEFAKKLDVTGGVEGLRKEVRQSMERELARGIKEHLKQQIFKYLQEANPVQVPQALIDAEIERMQQEVQQRLGVPKEKMPALGRDYFVGAAKQKVTLGLLLSQYIKKMELKPDPAKVRTVIEEMASAYENPEQTIAYFRNHPEYMSQIEGLVLEEMAVEKMLEEAQVEEKQASYEEVVGRKAEKNG